MLVYSKPIILEDLEKAAWCDENERKPFSFITLAHTEYDKIGPDSWEPHDQYGNKESTLTNTQMMELLMETRIVVGGALYIGGSYCKISED